VDSGEEIQEGMRMPTVVGRSAGENQSITIAWRNGRVEGGGGRRLVVEVKTRTKDEEVYLREKLSFGRH
jgi:hypothetical protein